MLASRSIVELAGGWKGSTDGTSDLYVEHTAECEIDLDLY